MICVLSYLPKSPKKKSTLCFPFLFSFVFSFASSGCFYDAPFSLCRVLRIKQLFSSDRLECQFTLSEKLERVIVPFPVLPCGSCVQVLSGIVCDTVRFYGRQRVLQSLRSSFRTSKFLHTE